MNILMKKHFLNYINNPQQINRIYKFKIMTRDEMLKINWKAYQEIHYKHPRMSFPLLCLLVEIDFDEQIMTLQPLFGEDYINEDFIATIENCSIPRKRMKAEIIYGKRNEGKKFLPIYQGSMNRINPHFEYDNLDIPDAS